MTIKLKVGDYFRPKEDYYYDYSLSTPKWLPLAGKDPSLIQQYGKVYADQVYLVNQVFGYDGPNHVAFNFILFKGNRVVSIDEREGSRTIKIGGGSLDLDQMVLVKKPPSKDKRVPRFVAILKEVDK